MAGPRSVKWEDSKTKLPWNDIPTWRLVTGRPRRVLKRGPENGRGKKKNKVTFQYGCCTSCDATNWPISKSKVK